MNPSKNATLCVFSRPPAVLNPKILKFTSFYHFLFTKFCRICAKHLDSCRKKPVGRSLFFLLQCSLYPFIQTTHAMPRRAHPTAIDGASLRGHGFGWTLEDVKDSFFGVISAAIVFEKVEYIGPIAYRTRGKTIFGCCRAVSFCINFQILFLENFLIFSAWRRATKPMTASMKKTLSEFSRLSAQQVSIVLSSWVKTEARREEPSICRIHNLRKNHIFGCFLSATCQTQPRITG